MYLPLCIPQITKLTPLEGTRYCVQYELYGCSTAPNECSALLSYDTTTPNEPDSSYRGNCNGSWCSGGLGILTDGVFSKLDKLNTYFINFLLACLCS